MYHNNDNNEQYGNNQGVPPTPAGVYGNPPACGGLYEGGSGFGQVSALQAAGESDEESSSSATSSSTSGSSSSGSTEPLLPPQPCGVCLQSRCVCNESNGFDPAILQLQLPQIALLMQQGNHMTSSPLPSPSSSSSTSFSPPSSPKPSSDFLSQPPPFVCQLCQEWFVVHEKLVLHLVVNHSMVYCKFCTRLFRSQSEHTICVAHQGTLPCQVCQAHFRTNSSTTCHDLAQHQSRAHDMHTCPFCGLAVRPREPFLSHLRKKHHCRDRLLLEKTMHSSGIVSEVSDTWSFLCKLCKKEYRKPELFGHFHTYHHLTLPCLIELLHCGRIFIPVSGYPASIAGGNTSNNISSNLPSSSSSNNSGIMYNHHLNNHHNQQQQQQNFNHNITSSCCTVCSKPFTVQVPKIAHDVFCAGMAYCQYCTLSFSSGLARELHLVREHSSLPCVSCGESFPAETSLTAHYARTHGAVLCCCCDTLVPVNPGNLEDHLATRHGCNVPANMTTLCQVGALLACNLCMTANKFTSVADDLPSIFIHLCQGHCMTPSKALNLLCRPSTHGGLSVGPPEEKSIKNEAPIKSPEVPQLTPQFEAPTPEWNNHENLKEEDEDAAENILVPQVNLNASSDNESSADEAPSSDGEASDEEEESPTRRRSTEADVDPEDMDCVSDSSDDEGLPLSSLEKLSCEMCAEKSFASPRDLCAHLFSIHKLHWDRKSLTDSDAQYHCESCAHKAPDRQGLARHRTQVHRGVAGRGGKCRFCPQLFQLAEARNQHQLQMHADQQRAFYRCPVCQLLTSSTVSNSSNFRNNNNFSSA